MTTGLGSFEVAGRKPEVEELFQVREGRGEKGMLLLLALTALLFSVVWCRVALCLILVGLKGASSCIYLTRLISSLSQCVCTGLRQAEGHDKAHTAAQESRAQAPCLLAEQEDARHYTESSLKVRA